MSCENSLNFNETNTSKAKHAVYFPRGLICYVATQLHREILAMDKCSPVEMRKALELVDVFKKTGIRFVPMPVFDDEDHAKTVAKMQDKLAVFAGDE